jgi:predicted DNA-binding transcriptional regulator YafY
MGQRSGTETVAAVMATLLARRSWAQADLARECGVRTETLRKVLGELKVAGLPLECEKDHPHVYWSLPKTWYPGGVLFKQDLVPELLRQLRRLPRGKSRERLLAVVVEQLPARDKSAAAAPVLSRAGSEHEERQIPIVEDAAARRVPLFMRYHTASRGHVSERCVSVHLVEIGPPARFIATCHRSGELRWFRVESIVHARLDEREPFRECLPGALATFRAASLDGYKDAQPSVRCSFFVREPESSWVANNLLEGMHIERLHDGIRVNVDTSAVLRLARFVVGLGSAAQSETAPLTKAVEELAQGALQQAQAAARAAEDRGSFDVSRGGPAHSRSGV